MTDAWSRRSIAQRGVPLEAARTACENLYASR